jgi:glycine oxidase
LSGVSIDSSTSAGDVLVVGCGLIGLACGAAAAERGFRVLIVGEPRVGAASLAAAGLLAPSIEREDGHAADFATCARDRYPAYIDWLYDRTGLDVPLNRDGIIQVALNEAGVRGLRRAKPAEAEWLDARELAELEPALSHGLGGVLHALDGAVDNVRLFEALGAAVAGLARVTVVSDTVKELRFNSHVEAVGQTGSRYSADAVVLAAGAWSSTITGLPRAIPVEPVRGQMIAYAGSPLRRAVYGPTGYVVPRTNGRTLVGATSERAGFESTTTPEGITKLARTAGEILPQFASSQPAEAWAGLRPISADLQPILGHDPEEPRLLYATGHSRNGVLMTPLTGDCIGALLAGERPPVDIGDFSITRFAVSS